jgi:hypothetical protein
MTGRKMEVRHIDGFAQSLYSTILSKQETRDQLPDDELKARILKAGADFVRYVSDNLNDSNAVVYTCIEWPQSGALVRGIIFAYNPRHPNDPEYGTPGFHREYTGQGHRVDGIFTWEQAEGDFHAYALAQFGRPQAVE